MVYKTTMVCGDTLGTFFLKIEFNKMHKNNQ